MKINLSLRKLAFAMAFLMLFMAFGESSLVAFADNSEEIVSTDAEETVTVYGANSNQETITVSSNLIYLCPDEVNDSISLDYRLYSDNEYSYYDGYFISDIKIMNKKNEAVGAAANIYSSYANLYFIRKDVPVGSYDLKYTLKDGTEYKEEDKIIVTEDVLINVVFNNDLYDSQRDYLYITASGINLQKAEMVPTITLDGTVLETKIAEVLPESCKTITYKLEKINWPSDVDNKSLKVSFKADKTVYVKSDAFSIYYSNLVNAVYNPRLNQLELVFGRKVKDGEIKVGVYNNNDHDRVKICDATGTVKNGEAILTPEVKIYEKLNGNSSFYVSYIDENNEEETRYVYFNYNMSTSGSPTGEIKPSISYSYYNREGDKNSFIGIFNAPQGDYSVVVKNSETNEEKTYKLEYDSKNTVDSKTYYNYKYCISDIPAGHYDGTIEVNGEKYTFNFTVITKAKKYIINEYGVSITYESNDQYLVLNYLTNATNEDKVTVSLTDINGNVVKKDLECEDVTDIRTSNKATLDRYYKIKGLKVSDLSDRGYYFKISINGKEPLRYNYSSNAEDKNFYSKETGNENGCFRIVVYGNYYSLYSYYSSDGCYVVYAFEANNATGPVEVKIYNNMNLSLIKKFNVELKNDGSSTYHQFTPEELEGIDKNTLYTISIKSKNGRASNVHKTYIGLYENSESIGHAELAVKQKYNVSKIFNNSNIKKYTVSNKKVASVTKKGVITAKKPGVVVVTGFVKVNKKWVSAGQFSVEVKKPVIEKQVLTSRGQAVSLNAILKDVPYESAVTWKYSKKANAVCTVSENSTDVLLANKSGKFKVTATIANNQGKSVKVSSTIKVQLPKLSKTKVNLKAVGKTYTLKVSKTDLPVEKWYSDNPAVATIDNGVITAVGSGDCSVYAVIAGVAYECKVHVK